MVDYNTDTITPFPALPTGWDEYFPEVRIGYPAHFAQSEDEPRIERRGETHSCAGPSPRFKPGPTPRVTHFSDRR